MWEVLSDYWNSILLQEASSELGPVVVVTVVVAVVVVAIVVVMGC